MHCLRKIFTDKMIFDRDFGAVAWTKKSDMLKGFECERTFCPDRGIG